MLVFHFYRAQSQQTQQILPLPQQLNTNSVNLQKESSTQDEKSPINWNLYRKESNELEQLIKDTYENYMKVPELHQTYRTEWEAFYYRRCFELIKEGINPEKYDFCDEWKKYFSQRLEYFKFLEVSDARQNLFKKHYTCILNQISECKSDTIDSKSEKATEKPPRPSEKSGDDRFKEKCSHSNSRSKRSNENLQSPSISTSQTIRSRSISTQKSKTCKNIFNGILDFK